MDVAIAIDGEAINVTRRVVTNGYTNGYATESVADTTISATVQPASGRQLMDVPEGVRAEASYLIWTRVAIALGDRFVFEGLEFKCVYVWPRPSDGFTRGALGQYKAP